VLTPTLICGYMGILIFMIIVLFFKKLNDNKEYGFIHLLMAFMYVMWLPIPIALYKIINNPLLIIGTIFGFTYLVMMVITMIIQTGHLVYVVKQENREIWQKQTDLMFATFGGPYEVFANILRGIWAVFLAIYFWENFNVTMAILMTIYGALAVYYLLLVIKISMVEHYNIFNRIKSNSIFFNIETLVFFIILIIYMQQLA